MTDTRESYYLALDPGESTGWATFNEDGNGNQLGTAKGRVEVYNLLRDVNPNTIIMEDWKTKQGAHLGGDRMETVRVIGAVEYYAYMHKCHIHEQPNTIKGIGYMWAGLEKPTSSDPMRHAKDAYVHGVHWLQKNGHRKPQQGVRRG